jgi:hypothetical protein
MHLSVYLLQLLARVEQPALDAHRRRRRRRLRRQHGDWTRALSMNNSLLFYGVGGKTNAMNDYARTLTDGPIVVVNGALPTLSVKHILNTITSVGCASERD